MAPRRKGAFELNEVVETPKTMPLDARQLVRSKEEMLDPEFRMPQIIKLQPEIIMHAKSGGELIR